MQNEIKVTVCEEQGEISPDIAKIFADMVKRMCENPEKLRRFEQWQAERCGMKDGENT